MIEHLALRLAVGVFLKASLALAVAGAVAAALRRHAAAARHAVWTAAVGVLLVLPVLTAVLPRWELPSAAGTPPPTLAVAAPVGSSAAAAPLVTPDPFPIRVTRPDQGGGARRPLAAAAVLVWLAGVAIGLGLVVRDLARVRALRGRAWRAGRADRASWYAAAIRRALGLARPVEVMYTPDLDVPAASGLFRPVVFLPDGARRWQADRVRVALLHEMAHVARHDLLPHLLTLVARAIYWPNPLVWLAARQALLEQERACDDAVLRAGARSDAYAGHLLAVARTLGSAAPAGVALAMARPHTLARRVRGILRPDADRGALARRTLLWTGTGALLAALPLGGVRLVAEAREARAERAALAQLADRSPEVRVAAAWILGDAGSERAVKPLLARLADSLPQVRGVAAWALGEIGDRDAVPTLVARLDDEDAYVREAAVLALGRLHAKTAVGRLAALRADSVMGVRAVLTVTLERLSRPEAIDALGEMALSDPDAHTRGMAIGALRRADPSHARTVLSRLLRDPDPGIRVSAARHLSEIATPALIPVLATVVETDSEPMVRAAAAAALGATGDPAALPALRRAQADSMFGVRVSANYALGKLGGPEAAAALLEAMRDPVHQVRLSAVEALDAMQGR